MEESNCIGKKSLTCCLDSSHVEPEWFRRDFEAIRRKLSNIDSGDEDVEENETTSNNQNQNIQTKSQELQTTLSKERLVHDEIVKNIVSALKEVIYKTIQDQKMQNNVVPTLTISKEQIKISQDDVRIIKSVSKMTLTSRTNMQTFSNHQIDSPENMTWVWNLQTGEYDWRRQNEVGDTKIESPAARKAVTFEETPHFKEYQPSEVGLQNVPSQNKNRCMKSFLNRNKRSHWDDITKMHAIPTYSINEDEENKVGEVGLVLRQREDSLFKQNKKDFIRILDKDLKRGDSDRHVSKILFERKQQFLDLDQSLEEIHTCNQSGIIKCTTNIPNRKRSQIVPQISLSKELSLNKYVTINVTDEDYKQWLKQNGFTKYTNIVPSEVSSKTEVSERWLTYTIDSSDKSRFELEEYCAEKEESNELPSISHTEKEELSFENWHSFVICEHMVITNSINFFCTIYGKRVRKLSLLDRVFQVIFFAVFGWMLIIVNASIMHEPSNRWTFFSK